MCLHALKLSPHIELSRARWARHNQRHFLLRQAWEAHRVLARSQKKSPSRADRDTNRKHREYVVIALAQCLPSLICQHAAALIGAAARGSFSSPIAGQKAPRSLPAASTSIRNPCRETLSRALKKNLCVQCSPDRLALPLAFVKAAKASLVCGTWCRRKRRHLTSPSRQT
jgi:hypothetical protein